MLPCLVISHCALLSLGSREARANIRIAWKAKRLQDWVSVLQGKVPLHSICEDSAPVAPPPATRDELILVELQHLRKRTLTAAHAGRFRECCWMRNPRKPCAAGRQLCQKAKIRNTPKFGDTPSSRVTNEVGTIMIATSLHTSPRKWRTAACRDSEAWRTKPPQPE